MPDPNLPGSQDAGTPDPNTPAKLPDEALDQLVPVTVDGETKMVTVKEAVQSYQIRKAADKRMAEAHADKEAAKQAALVLKGLQDGYKAGDVETISRSLKLAGWDEEVVTALLNPAPGGDDTAGSIDDGGDGEADDTAPVVKDKATAAYIRKLEATVSDLQKWRESQEQKHKKDADADKRKKVETQVRSHLDKDPMLGKMISGIKDDSRRALAERFVQGAIGEAYSKSPVWGPDVIKEGLEIFKGLLKEMSKALEGTPGEGGAEIGFLPGAGANLHRTVEPKPKKLFEKGFGDYLRHNLLKSTQPPRG